MSATERKRMAPIWVQVFFFFHCACIWAYTLPNPPKALKDGVIQPNPENVVRYFPDFVLLANDNLRKNPYSPVGYYLLPTGLWQYWDMFAPNPASTDVWIDTIVTYSDGTVETVAYPRMYDLNLFDKYFMERHRKFVERLNGDQYSWKWPTFAHRIAQNAYKDPKNPPALVVLRRHWFDVPPPGELKGYDYNEFNFYRHAVSQEKLLRDVKK